MWRRRWIIVLAVVVTLLAVVEVVVRRWESPKACVQIINEGGEAIEDLVVYYANSRLPMGRLLRNQSVHVWLTTGPVGPLRLEFRQKGNALQGFQIPDFDPSQLIQDSYKQVLIVGTNQIQRFAQEDDTRKNQESVGEIIKRWLKAELNQPQ
jgi:hypothetical protein